MAETSGFEEEIARKAVEYPLEVLKDDFNRTIDGLNEEDALKKKIREAFNSGNKGIILRIIDLSRKSFAKDPRKQRLAAQAGRRLENSIFPKNIAALEYSHQRHWIREKASWNELISVFAKNPEVKTARVDVVKYASIAPGGVIK